MSTIAKFNLTSVTHHQGGIRILNFKPVCADELPENQRFHKYTPSGSLEINVTNPNAFMAAFPGQDYYLTFTLANDEKSQK